MKRKFKLGPIQKKWIANLIKYPRRKMTKQLGRKNKNGTYRACCLGEDGLIAGVCEWKGNTLTAKGTSGISDTSILYDRLFEALGLIDSHGSSLDGKGALTAMNDNGWTWPAIGKELKKNPEKWFTKSV